MKMSEIREVFQNIKIVLARKKPFLYFLLNEMKVVYEPQLQFPAATDGTKILLQDEFFKFDFPQQTYVTVHELLHTVFRHVIRTNKLARNSELVRAFGGYERFFLVCNVVADAKVNYCINSEFRKASLPLHGFNSETLEKKSFEEIIWDLLKKMKGSGGGGSNKGKGKGQSGKGQGRGSGRTGNKIIDKILSGTEPEVESLTQKIKDLLQKKLQGGQEIQKGKDIDSEIPEEVEKKIIEAVKKAYAKARMAGKGAGTLERIVQELFESQVPWHKLLRKLVQNWSVRMKINDWRRINRRVPNVLPGHQVLSDRKVYAFIDVSGSISDEEWNRFVSELVRPLKNIELQVIIWDDDIREEVKIRSKAQLLKLKPKGYGGTDFYPVIQKYRKIVKPGDLMVVFTDGYISRWNDCQKILKTMRGVQKVLVTVAQKVEGFDDVIEVKE